MWLMSSTNKTSKSINQKILLVLINLTPYSFRVVGLHVSHFKHQLTIRDQIRLSRNMSEWNDLPSLFHGHFAYFDPKKWVYKDLNVKTRIISRVGVDLTPVYINMVRDPLERLVSHYYFLRYFVFLIIIIIITIITMSGTGMTSWWTRSGPRRATPPPSTSVWPGACPKTASPGECGFRWRSNFF